MSTYVDMGKYQFVTGPDQTGYNPGNMTSVFDTSSVSLSNFEIYRMMFNIAGIPAGLPDVVQSVEAPGTSNTALTITMPVAVTKGNMVVVCVGTFGDTLNPLVTGVTIGGVADNFGNVGTAGSGALLVYASMWADPNCQQASSTIVVTMGSGTGGGYEVLACAYEVRNTLANSSLAACFDNGSAVYRGTAASTFATPTVNTTGSNDMQIGFGMAHPGSTPAPMASNAPGWNDLAQLGPVTNPSSLIYTALSSWMVAPSAGGLIYPQKVTTATNTGWALIVASFFQAAVTSLAATTFSVAIDGVTWDAQETTAGSAYTYDLHQPLYLNTGQSVQVLWNLDAATYGAYGKFFQCTAWLRYDADSQPGPLQ
jgi:hypothetical protein